MGDDFRAPATDDEWRAYHEIRREVLFERRGRGAAYDANRPDEHLPNHHPHIFWHDGEPAGVIRVDVTGEVAIFRRVAIKEALQRRGLGRRMLECAEGFAIAEGATCVESHVAIDAVGFYERCGFRCVETPRASAESVLMTKRLPPQGARSNPQQ